MASKEVLTESLQEAVLAVLTFDQKYGALISAQVQPEHFDGIYNEVATAVLAYRKRYNKPPGRAHLENLFSKAKVDPGDRKTHSLRRALVALANQAEGINAEYVAGRAQDFIRAQDLKSALLAANERYMQGGDDLVDEVERILHGALKSKRTTLDAGTFLNDIGKAFEFLNKADEFCSLGIPELDRLELGLVPKQLLLYIAPKGCLAGDTLVDCPRDLQKYPQGIPIKELVGTQFLTYSWDFNSNRPRLSKVLDVWSSGVKPTYRVRLSAKLREKVGSKNGGVQKAKYLPPLELVGTYDHPVLLSDNTWKALGELQPGDSLKSLYRRAEGLGAYCCLTWTGVLSTAAVREHRFICEHLLGMRDKKTHAHHKDGAPYNNNPSNLEWLEGREHASYHLGKRNKQGTVGWRVTGKHPRGMKDKNHSVENKLRQKSAMIEVVKSRVRNSSGRFEKSPNHTVVSVEFAGNQEVFDMEVEGTSNFVANGVFVHNSGKSWFSVHAGRQGLMQKQKVLHVSLEMDETLVIPRYYQSFFGISKRPDPVPKAEFELDELHRLTGFKIGRLKPKLSFSDPEIRKFLRAKVQHWGARFGRLVVKAFPSGSLTVPQLEGYLDYLELTHNFIPTVLIVDYLDLMRQDIGNLRASLTKTVVDLRGLADKRNLALIAPTQSNRSGIGAKKVSSTNVSEDIGKVFTADTVLSYSQTEEERKFGLARLTVEHARNSETGACVLLAQSYATGQYILESATLTNAYWERLESVTGKEVSLDGDDP